MLLDLFEYFAKFPATAGVTKGIANKGESSMEEYATVLKAIKEMPEKELVPEIENYVYGQSFDELKQRIDKLTGSFLFVDYGEVDMQSDGRRSFQCTQRIAVTVAMKLSAHADMLERVIANDRTLQMLSKVHVPYHGRCGDGRTLLDGPGEYYYLRDYSVRICRTPELRLDPHAFGHRCRYPGCSPAVATDGALASFAVPEYLCNFAMSKKHKAEML